MLDSLSRLLPNPPRTPGRWISWTVVWLMIAGLDLFALVGIVTVVSPQTVVCSYKPAACVVSPQAALAPAHQLTSRSMPAAAHTRPRTPTSDPHSAP